MKGKIEGSEVNDACAAIRDTDELLRIDGITRDEFAHVKDILIAEYQVTRKRPETMAKRLIHFLVNDDPMKTRVDEIPEMARALTLDDVNAVIGGLLSVFDEMMRIVTASKDNALKADGMIMSVVGA